MDSSLDSSVTSTTKHRSVVYVLDRTTPKPTFKATIVLPCYSHVGGISYDKNFGYLWVALNYHASNKSTTAEAAGYVNCIDFNGLKSQIDAANGGSISVTSFSRKTASLGSGYSGAITAPKPIPDAMTYSDGSLYICRYEYKEAASYNGISAVSRYEPGKNSSGTTTTDGTTLAYGRQEIIKFPCDRVQGFDFVNDSRGKHLIVSRSYSRNPDSDNYISEICIYKDTGSTGSHNYQLKGRIKMPPMCEGISYDSDNKLLYVTFESGAYKYVSDKSGIGTANGTYCPAPVDRIAALDIEDYLNYDKVLDLGALDGKERVILDKDLPGTTIGPSGNTMTYDNSGEYFKYNSKALDVATFNSSVAAGQKVLVRVSGDCDVALRADTNSSGGLGTADIGTSTGLYVTDGGTLEVKSVVGDSTGEVTIGRNAFGDQTINTTYLEPIINVEKGGTLNITNDGHSKIVFKGGTSNYVKATNSIIRTVAGGTGSSKWSIDGVKFKQITTAQNTKYGYAPCVLAYANFSDFTMKNCDFIDVFPKKGTAPTSTSDKTLGRREGAALYFAGTFNSPTVTVENCKFDNDFNLSKADGYALNPFVSVTNSTNNKYLMTTDPSKLTIDEDELSEFEGVRFQGTVTDTMTFNNVSFNNILTEFGAMGFVRRNYTDSTACKLEDTDGAINKLVMNNVSIDNCRMYKMKETKIATNAGGTTEETHYYGPLTFGKAITTLTVTNPRITNCVGNEGSGIVFDNSISNKNDIGAATISGDAVKSADSKAYFYNNYSRKNGGAIGVFGKINSLTLDKICIKACRSANGSAILIRNEAVVPDMKLTNSLVTDCISEVEEESYGQNYAGTIRTTGPASCVLSIDNCLITNNTVWKDGGGVYWNAKGTNGSITSKLKVTNSEISHNNAARSGGGIYCEADMEISDTVVSHNTAVEDGGGICQTVYDNSSEAIQLNQTELALGNNVQVFNNYCLHNGGGIAISLRDSNNLDGAGEVTSSGYAISYKMDTTGTAPKVTNNYAGDFGGGVYYGIGYSVSSPKQVPNYQKQINLLAGEISSNQAGKDGGGIYAKGKGVEIVVSNNNIINNYAGFNATSIDGVPQYCTAEITTKSATNANVIKSETIKNNITLPPVAPEPTGKTTENYYGGGVYMDGENSGITLTLTSGQISGNTAKAGAGICARYKASVTVNGGSIDNNSAVRSELGDNHYQNGGGVYATDSGSSIRVINGSVNNNSCYFRGGGIYASYGATVSMEGGNISGNTAVYDGGGIAAFNNSAVTVTGGNIEHNAAGANNGAGGGGAVFALGGTVTVTGGLIRYNNAYGANSGTTSHATAAKTNGFGGVGGGICISGNANPASFSLSGSSIGIYSNEAEFAADDVYASGYNTKLSVPNKSAMNLSDYKGNAIGWFEDYNNGDSDYTSGTNLAKTEQTGSRYRTLIQKYPNKYLIKDVNTAETGGVAVNAENSYVCMTLGTIANARVSNNIYTADGVLLNGTDNTKFTYTISSSSPLTSKILTYEKGGATYVPEISGDVYSYEFTLIGGEEIAFPNLTDDLSLTITQTTTKSNLSNLKKTEYRLNSGSLVNETYNCSFTSQSGVENSLVYNNYIDKYIEVVINYYNREVVNGKPADMSNEPKSISINTLISGTYVKDGKIDTAKLIADAAVKAENEKTNGFDNVIESYCVWTSQKAAKEGIATQTNPRTGSKYPQSEYHTDCYGNLKSSGKWVTYNDDALVENASGVLDNTADLSKISVWLFNTPKKYSVSYYGASSDYSTTVSGTPDTFVYTNNDGSPQILSGIYYNQRLGYAEDNETDTPETNTNHLTQYGISNTADQKAVTASTITVNGRTYYFKGWSTDRTGSTIVSSDNRYRYRVTNDITLYPVYSKTNTKTVGLSATANTPDVFIDTDGTQKTRLNTVMNPYGCPDNDTNISKVAIVYVTDAKGNLVQNKAKVQTAIKQALDSNDSNIADLKNVHKPMEVYGNDQTTKVTIGNANYFVHLVSETDVTLTVKNRVQFTTTFKTSQLIGKSLAAFVAMKYNYGTSEEWTVSDNYINYTFDATGKMIGSSSVTV